MSKKAVTAKKSAQKPYPTKTIIIGFVILLGFSACESMKNQEEPVPEVQQTAPSLLPTAYPIPPDGAKNRLGETRSESEQRYLQYVHQQSDPTQTDEELINTGYALCGYFKESSSRLQLFEKIDTASNDDRGRRAYLIDLSSYASQTLCPEFSNFE